MGRYTPEPPRRNCQLHLPFDYLNGNEVTDISPQANDSELVGESVSATGFVGTGLKFDGSTYVDVPSGLLSTDKDFTVALYVDPRQSANDQRILALRADIELAIEITDTNDLRIWTGSWHTIESDISSPKHLVIAHDANLDDTAVTVNGGTMLEYNEAVGSGSNTNIVGRDSTASQKFARSVVDDIRVYDTLLSESERHAIYTVGSEHQRIDDMNDAWPNDGMPFVRGQGNANLAGALAEADDHVLRTVDGAIEARHINDAAGEQLDRIGAVAGVRRQENEADGRYRARIIGTVAAGRSDGTFQGIVESTAAILDTTIGRVFLEHGWEHDATAGIATARVFVRTEDLDNSNLTASDLTTIMQDVVVGGHDIEILERAANSFTLINDTMTTDPKQGLTSDSIATGGGLTSDV